ncbi:MAG: transposase [Candidatus Stygibacter australis]|nr:transposase [Candidatus Stygibacter australis]
MVKIKNKDQLEIVGVENWRNGYSLKKIARLEKSWALVFREYILPYLPVKFIKKFYFYKTGRNSKELYSTIGAAILQQFFDLSDAETVEKLAFDQQWHVALDCFDDEDQVMCERTLFSMHTHISEENLADKIFALATDVMVEALQIDVSKQRLDSVHVNSNMAC